MVAILVFTQTVLIILCQDHTVVPLMTEFNLPPLYLHAIHTSLRSKRNETDVNGFSLSFKKASLSSRIIPFWPGGSDIDGRDEMYSFGCTYVASN